MTFTERAVPKQDAPRTVPVTLRDDLKKKLHEMEQKGHIAKVDEPTDWMSSAVYVYSAMVNYVFAWIPEN